MVRGGPQTLRLVCEVDGPGTVQCFTIHNALLMVGLEEWYAWCVGFRMVLHLQDGLQD